jgi:hypothetical protein
MHTVIRQALQDPYLSSGPQLRYTQGDSGLRNQGWKKTPCSTTATGVQGVVLSTVLNRLHGLMCGYEQGESTPPEPAWPRRDISDVDSWHPMKKHLKVHTVQFVCIGNLCCAYCHPRYSTIQHHAGRSVLCAGVRCRKCLFCLGLHSGCC